MLKPTFARSAVLFGLTAAALASSLLAAPKVAAGPFREVPLNAVSLTPAMAELTSESSFGLKYIGSWNGARFYKWVVSYDVRNTGQADSVPFVTLVRVWLKKADGSTSSTPLTFNIPTQLRAGNGLAVWGYCPEIPVEAPYGIARVYVEADATHVVPEEHEADNWFIFPKPKHTDPFTRK